jgi:hypothetical protein
MPYTAQPKQLLFHFSEADETLYGGAAGGGKSAAILWDAIEFCLSHDKVRAAIFRRTYPELEKSIIFEFLKQVNSKIYRYSKQEHRVVFKQTGSVLEFNHCQYEQDVYKFQSAEYDRIYFDELTHFTLFIYQYLLSRLRTTRTDIKPQVKAASNPGNVGHLWVNNRFIAGVKVNTIIDRVDEESGAEYTTEFIPAKVQDNKFIVERDLGYIGRLQRLPEDERKALLDGDWNAFKGQFFKEWKTKYHVCQPFEIPDNWKKFRCLDWGYRNPSACLWLAVDPDGRVYVYRELYQAGLTDGELAHKILEMSGREEIAYTVADPSLWSVTQFERGESIAMRLMENGVELIKGDNARISGANVVRAYLELQKVKRGTRWYKQPTLVFFSNCQHSISTVPALIFDRNNSEDVDTSGDDHAYDALRYGLMSRPLPKYLKTSNEPPENSFMGLMRKITHRRELKKYIGGDK